MDLPLLSGRYKLLQPIDLGGQLWFIKPWTKCSNGSFRSRSCEKIIPMTVSFLSVSDRKRRQRRTSPIPISSPFMISVLIKTRFHRLRICGWNRFENSYPPTEPFQHRRHTWIDYPGLCWCRLCSSPVWFTVTLNPQHAGIKDFRLKVTDFGIARALATIHPEERSEVVWGSPHYFSPEQASGYAPSPASDVYSLGVILYEMLTGRLPFEAKDATELARMHRMETPVPPRRLNPAIPEPLEEITLKVLSKEPAARYRTADQLGRVLMSFGNLNPEKTGPIILPVAKRSNISSPQPHPPVIPRRTQTETTS